VKIRIAARPSRLSLIQVNILIRELEEKLGSIDYDIIKVKSHGDLNRTAPFDKIGVTGIFEKKVNETVLSGKADIAVHSMKDLPTVIDPRLTISYVTRRGDPRDAIVSIKEEPGYLHELPEGAVVGTSSARRRSLVLHYNPSLRVKGIRGNIETRLGKLGKGYDYIIVSAAALDRIDSNLPHLRLPVEYFPPAPGQGFIAATSLRDSKITDILMELVDSESYTIAMAERALLSAFGGGCSTPIGGYCRVHGETGFCRGVLLSDDGSRMFSTEFSGAKTGLVEIGEKVGRALRGFNANAG
jgi:hydroxymethylbilane synthase